MTTQRNTIVMIEDDRALCSAVESAFPQDSVFSFYDLPQTDDQRLAKALTDAQALLLDETLPSGSGFEFASQLKSTHPDLPIIFITANATKDLAIKCLNLGIDRFLEKPFSLQALREQVTQQIQRKTKIAAGGDFVLNLNAKALELRGEVLPLTATEYRLVEVLILEAGKCISKAEMHHRLWSDRAMSGNTIDTHLSNLKKKIPDAVDRLVNVRNRGYLWSTD